MNWLEERTHCGSWGGFLTRMKERVKILPSQGDRSARRRRCNRATTKQDFEDVPQEAAILEPAVLAMMTKR